MKYLVNYNPPYFPGMGNDFVVTGDVGWGNGWAFSNYEGGGYGDACFTFGIGGTLSRWKNERMYHPDYLIVGSI